MGDQAKGIAKVIPFLLKDPNARLPQLRELGDMVGTMLHQGMKAYANDDIDLAGQVVAQDVEADKIYAQISTQIMEQMAQTTDKAKVEASYKVIRAARELERFGDLAAHIGERVIFKVTGQHS
jgi:phosphate uptake regulator